MIEIFRLISHLIPNYTRYIFQNATLQTFPNNRIFKIHFQLSQTIFFHCSSFPLEFNFFSGFSSCSLGTERSADIIRQIYANMLVDISLCFMQKLTNVYASVSQNSPILQASWAVQKLSSSIIWIFAWSFMEYKLL